MGDWADEPQWDEFENDPCYCCDGTGLVSPTNTRVPSQFLILGTETCPVCDGTGEQR